jgi:UDP-N-acetylmuramoyl-tripeptide--D-alanyl-D-alanine ligase
VRAVAGRLQFKRTQGGAWLIDDSYNANPSSVRAAIEVLAELDGSKWLVLGDMAELGDFAKSSHAEIGEFARARGIERLFATGELTALTVQAFGAGGQWFADAQSLAAALAKALHPQVRLLIKGSRMNHLERLVDALTAAPAQAAQRH